MSDIYTQFCLSNDHIKHNIDVRILEVMMHDVTSESSAASIEVLLSAKPRVPYPPPVPSPSRSSVDTRCSEYMFSGTEGTLDI